MRTIILASGSPRRRELLAQIGLQFTVIPSTKTEVIRFQDPAMTVEDLSRQKAEDVGAQAPDGALVIGSDTVVALDGKILGKPHDAEDAVRMLTLLQGRAHEVFTGVTVLEKDAKGDKMTTFSDRTLVRIYPMTEEEIRAYVATGDPLDKAGAYGIQGGAGAFVEGLDGSFENVMGFPVDDVERMLRVFTGEG